MIKDFEETEANYQTIYELTREFHPYSTLAGSYQNFKEQYQSFLQLERVRILTGYHQDQIVAVFLPMSLEGWSKGMILTTMSADCPIALIDDLLTQSIDYFKSFSLSVAQIISRDIDPPHYTQVILNKGFVHNDQSFLSEYQCHQDIPQFLLEKQERFYQEHQGRCLTLQDLQTQDADWQRHWYEFEQNTMLDVPSAVPMEKMSFTDWERLTLQNIKPSACLLFLTIGQEIVGMIHALQSDNVYFIEFTGVAAQYRRQGFSSLLKVELIQHARTEKIQAIRTMNHQANPMFQLNQAFGFKVLEVQKTYALKID